MDTRKAETRTAYDEAIAAILRGRMAELKMSRADLAEASGLSPETFRRYLDGSRSIPMGNYFSLVTALQLDLGYVAEAAMTRVASSTGD